MSFSRLFITLAAGGGDGAKLITSRKRDPRLVIALIETRILISKL